VHIVVETETGFVGLEKGDEARGGVACVGPGLRGAEEEDGPKGGDEESGHLKGIVSAW